MESVILRTVVSYVRPILIALAAWLFLKGHNAPGGGFIAGLLGAVSVILIYISSGRRYRFGEDAYVRLIAVGLGLALVTALAPTIGGYAFFTHTFGFFEVPVLGEVELASASLFDLGVLLVVVGNVVTVIRAITDEKP